MPIFVLAALLGTTLGVIAGLMEARLWIDPRRQRRVDPRSHLLPLGIVTGGDLVAGVLYGIVVESRDATIVLGIALTSSFLLALMVIGIVKWQSR